MRKSILLTLCLAGLLCPLARAASPTNNLALIPVGRFGTNETWWPKRHEEKLHATNREQAEIVFIGDSITHGWEGKGREVWQKYYACYHALNLGYGGDRTEHVLWRLDHGEVDGLSPKAIVLMIGTNNTGHRKDKPEEIAAGVKVICERLEAKMPKAKILLLSIFPRSANPQDFPRVNNDHANALLAKLADNKRVFFDDINKVFLSADGTLSKEIMPDLLHPNAKGYELWAEAMQPELDKLLKSN